MNPFHLKAMTRMLLALLTIVSALVMAQGSDLENKEILPSVEKPNTVRGIYLTASSVASKRFDAIIDQTVASGGNAVVLDIEHGGGKLAFEPQNEWLKEINPGTSTLNHYKDIVSELHRKGLYVIARQVVFNDPYVALRKPEWRIKYKGGGLFDSRWIDPSNPETQKYNLLTMREVAEFGFDEIQLDYIRFPATSHYWLDYHYDESAFERTDIINDFLSKAKIITEEYNIDLSVDVFGAIVWGNIDWKIVGQSIPEMAEHVDVIYPMTYPSHYSPGFYGIWNMYYAPYDVVYKSLERFQEQAAGKAEIRPWIQGFKLKAANFGNWYIADQIKAGYDAYSTGFVIWNARNDYYHSWDSLKMLPEDMVYVSEQGT